jgi:hypothetical protein
MNDKFLNEKELNMLRRLAHEYDRGRRDERAKVNAEWRERIKNSIEELSTLEHDQWIFWSQSVVGQILSPKNNGNETSKRFSAKVKSWSNYWRPYKDLIEEEKEYDRIWARKIIDKLLSGGENGERPASIGRSCIRDGHLRPERVQGSADRQNRRGEKKEVK